MNTSAFKDTDPAQLARFLDQHLVPSIRWEMAIVQLGGVDVGLIFVWQNTSKPVVCGQDYRSDLREGEVYFRYAGYTTRIKYPELQSILSHRDLLVEQRWQKAISQIRNIGIERAAVMDIESGVVTGAAGAFVIDESLLPKLAFIKEGEFKNETGKPTLKLVGDLHLMNNQRGPSSIHIEHRPITEHDIIEAYVFRQVVSNPIAYIRQLCHLQSKWLPVYYLIAQSNKPMAEVINILQSERVTHQRKKAAQIDRIVRRHPPSSVSKTAYLEMRKQLLAGEVIELSDEDLIVSVLRAMRTLTHAEISNNCIFPMLEKLFTAHFGGENRKLTDEIRYASTYLDFIGA